MLNDLVTVCITTYNRKSLLPLTLQSVINQTYNNLDIMIVDDCSTDGTKELIENELLKLDNRIRYIRHEENKGLAVGRNTAIFSSIGKYFTFCDDDDEWNPTFIEEFVKIADRYNANWCFCCGSKQGEIERKLNFKGTLKEIIYKGYTPPVASQFYYLESLIKIEGYNTNIKSGVDHDLWLKLAVAGVNIASLEQVLSIPNKNIFDNRMTTNEIKRLAGIKASLKIWEPLIKENFSSKFYLFFKKNYMYYIRKNFLHKAIKAKNITQIIKNLILINKYFLLKEIVRKMLNQKNKPHYAGPSFFRWNSK